MTNKFKKILALIVTIFLEGKYLETNYVQVYYGLNKQEKNKFETEVIHNVDEYINFWQQSFGFSIKEKIVIYVQQSPDTKKIYALTKEKLDSIFLYSYYTKQQKNNHKKSAIILGGKLGQNEPMYLKKDVLYHELAHWFFEHLLQKPSTDEALDSLEEMFADLLAVTFLNDPCRYRKNDHTCVRDLSKHTFSLKESCEFALYPHDQNEAVAHFAWEIFQTVGLKNFAQLLLLATKNIIFAHKQNLFANNFELLSSFASNLCVDQNPQTYDLCQRLEVDFLGNHE